MTTENTTTTTTPEPTKETIIPVVSTEQELARDLIKTAVSTEKSSTTLWNKTGAIMMNDKDIYSNSEYDKKELAKAFTVNLDDNCDLDKIPVKGTDRKGESIVLRKKSGKIKWSSWNTTSRIMQNTSDIFKGIEEFGFDTVFPKGEIISRYELIQMLKEVKAAGSGETPAETIIRCLELVGKKIDELDKIDGDSVNIRLMEVAGQFSDWFNKK